MSFFSKLFGKGKTLPDEPARDPSPPRVPVKRKYATAYLCPDRLMIHSLTQTDFGMFACEPFRRLDREAPPEEIARCIRCSLDAFRIQRDMPGAEEVRKSWLAGMGVKSNAEIQRTALCVGISQAAALEFEPTHNGGTASDSKGFQPIPGVEPLRVSTDSPPAEIGAALLKAFSLCTTVYA